MYNWPREPLNNPHYTHRGVRVIGQAMAAAAAAAASERAAAAAATAVAASGTAAGPRRAAQQAYTGESAAMAVTLEAETMDTTRAVRSTDVHPTDRTEGRARPSPPKGPSKSPNGRPTRRTRPTPDESTQSRIFGAGADPAGAGRPSSEGSDDVDKEELNILPRRWRKGESTVARGTATEGPPATAHYDSASATSAAANGAADDDASVATGSFGRPPRERDVLNEGIDHSRSPRQQRPKGQQGADVFGDDALGPTPRARHASGDPLDATMDPNRKEPLLTGATSATVGSRGGGSVASARTERSERSEGTALTPRELKESLEKRFSKLVAEREAEGLTFDGQAVPSPRSPRSPRSASPRSPRSPRSRSASPRP